MDPFSVVLSSRTMFGWCLSSRPIATKRNKLPTASHLCREVLKFPELLVSVLADDEDVVVGAGIWKTVRIKLGQCLSDFDINWRQSTFWVISIRQIKSRGLAGNILGNFILHERKVVLVLLLDLNLIKSHNSSTGIYRTPRCRRISFMSDMKRKCYGSCFVPLCSFYDWQWILLCFVVAFVFGCRHICPADTELCNYYKPV